MSEREIFEEWVKKEHPHIYSGSLKDNEDGVRFKMDVDFMFSAWQASANREGYKLVPVEPSDHMKCVVRDFDPDIEDYANMDKSEWESLCSDIYKAMIGACDD